MSNPMQTDVPTSVTPILVNNALLQVTRCGAGEPLLLVHGFPLDHTMWQNQFAVLAQTHQVIAPDLRGFGSSGGLLPTLTMAQHADDLAMLLDELKISSPVVLCGLSMGGYIAFEFYRRHPSKLRALVLCDTRAAADSPEAVAGRVAMAERVSNEGAKVAAEAMLPKLFSAQTKSDSAIYRQTEQVILNTSPQAIVAAQHGMVERADMTGQLPKIHVPTLVICGADDGITSPTEMQTMAQAIPRSKFAAIPAAGHLSPLENPAEFNQILTGFLTNLSA